MIRATGRDVPVARIVLIGFMGAGKSTVGRRLARIIGWDFVDFDEEIERVTGRSVPEIFREEGQPAFRELEADVTEEVADLEEVVLAPGGGWITQPALLDVLGPDTFVVWLRISPEEAVDRAERDRTRRPLLAGPDPVAKAETLIASREPLYRSAADAVIDVDALDPDEVAWAVVDLLDEIGAGGPEEE